MVKFTVKTSDLKEVLKSLNDSLKKGFNLFFEFNENTLKIWLNDYRYLNIREFEIPSEITNDKNLKLLFLYGQQIKQLKQAIRYYKKDYLTIEIKDNENYEKRQPTVLKHKLIVNSKEIEIN